MNDTITFESREQLAKHLYDRCLKHCGNYRERLCAAAYAVHHAERLWNEYGGAR